MSYPNYPRHPPQMPSGGNNPVNETTVALGALALYGTVLFGPAIYDLTAAFMKPWIEDLYGYGAWDIFKFGHMGVVGIATYYFLKSGLKYVAMIAFTASARYGAHFTDLWPMKLLDFIF